MPSGKRFVAILLFAYATSVQANAQAWIRTEQSDALTGAHYSEFELAGKFLARPGRPSLDAPVMVVHCLAGKRPGDSGKFAGGFIKTGTVLNIETAVFRLDDGKIQPSGVGWSASTNGLAAFFPIIALNKFLYGHMIRHKEGTSDPVKKVVVAINEFIGAQVVMQFDMPDPTEVADACGLVAHKKAK